MENPYWQFGDEEGGWAGGGGGGEGFRGREGVGGEGGKGGGGGRKKRRRKRQKDFVGKRKKGEVGGGGKCRGGERESKRAIGIAEGKKVCRWRRLRGRVPEDNRENKTGGKVSARV